MTTNRKQTYIFFGLDKNTGTISYEANFTVKKTGVIIDIIVSLVEMCLCQIALCF